MMELFMILMTICFSAISFIILSKVLNYLKINNEIYKIVIFVLLAFIIVPICFIISVRLSIIMYLFL